MNTIKEGDFVVLRGSDNGRLVQVDRKKPVFFGKKKINIHAAIGESFGSVFELCNMNLRKITAAEYKKRCSECEVPGGDAQTTAQDNRNLVDNNSSQRLTREDIETFKADGTSGETIVRTLVENSATFRDKTEYSQRKYLHKKQKKYQPHLTLEAAHRTPAGRGVLLAEPPQDRVAGWQTAFREIGARQIRKSSWCQGGKATTGHLAEKRVPTCHIVPYCRIGQEGIEKNMRVDSLAQMLTCCNVRSGGRYVVFDSWLGLLTAAVLERLGQDGSVVQVYAGHGPCSASSETPTEDAPKGGPSSEVEMAEVAEDSSLANNSGSTATKQPLESNGKSAAATDPKVCIASLSLGMLLLRKTVAPPHIPKNDYKDAERAARKQRRMQEQEKALDLLRTRSLDGLLVASKHHPTAIVLSLLEFVAPSRPFAVFCSYQEPLVDCYAQLKDAGSAVFLKISESWLRSYQVGVSSGRQEGGNIYKGGSHCQALLQLRWSVVELTGQGWNTNLHPFQNHMLRGREITTRLVLPDRTHPAINMSGGGGYVLSGIKVTG
ncbi:hypothetical protein HPB48_003814 [Haemaphysalis longicornis]|uniref:tRNA (adenine(58)-N(1))-methyltransferase non-catalytic subunit TRM6 n=1 Tax=Haemaphysalis longicornis TaxID=44386 RepID=A0A9J6GKM4_HAELO|nr:hypothetical protein HPB48_003814 [Haemaphysalis longicornis]